MNSSTEAYMTGSFQTSQNMGSASRSNSTASYLDYAPPAYEVVVSMTLPETVPESGILEAMASEKRDTTTTVQEVESVMSHHPIDPPPHCFNRTPTFDTPPEPLTQPFVVQGKPGKKFLDDAFEIIGTSALEMYDVLSHDWVRMLEDIRLAARLTKGQKRTSQVLPVTMYMGCTGFFASRAIEKRMKKKNAASVVGLLDIWNERFFKPRGIKIMLCRKDWQVSGTSACGHVQLPAPDRPNARSRQKDCCGARKWERYANGHTDKRFDGTSKCTRGHERCKEREANREQQRQSCPSGREGYRLVVVSI